MQSLKNYIEEKLIIDIGFDNQQKKQRDAKKEQEKELNELFKAVITAPKVIFFI